MEIGHIAKTIVTLVEKYKVVAQTNANITKKNKMVAEACATVLRIIRLIKIRPR